MASNISSCVLCIVMIAFAKIELGYKVDKVDKSSSNGAISINVTRRNLMMVAQCVMADMKTYLDGVMVRVGKTLAIQNERYSN